MSAGKIMEDICNKLDVLTLEIFDVLENLYEAQEKLSQLMKQGFLSMSKARYVLGVKNVSSDQFVDANLVASTLVDVKESSPHSNGGDALENIKESNQEGKLFSLSELVEHKLNKPAKDIPVAVTNADNPTGPRKRHKDNSSKQEVQTQQTTLVSYNEEEGAPRAIYSGLSLFGILTPLSLRASQQDFKASLKVCMEIANLKYKLQTLKTNYRVLNQTKAKLKSES